MARAGNLPLDRARAHARWAERYDEQGDTQRSTAHFGRAMHYAQMVQAFGAPDRGPWPLEADLGNIGIGLWEKRSGGVVHAAESALFRGACGGENEEADAAGTPRPRPPEGPS